MVYTDGRPTIAWRDPPAEDSRWCALRAFLATPAANWYVDSAAESCLPKYEAADLLLGYGITPDAGAYRKLGQLCHEALT